MTETHITTDVMGVAVKVVVDDSMSLVEVLAVSRVKNAADTYHHSTAPGTGDRPAGNDSRVSCSFW